MKRSLLVCLALLLIFLGFIAGYAVGASVPRGIAPSNPTPTPTALPSSPASLSPAPSPSRSTEPPGSPTPTVSAAAQRPTEKATPSAAPTATPIPPSPEHPLNLNTADAEALCALPGIGETLAGRILAFREAHGPFAAPEELMLVEGIGEKRYERIRDLVCTE